MARQMAPPAMAMAAAVHGAVAGDAATGLTPLQHLPALKGDYERIELGDPRTAVHQQRLSKLIADTEQWVTAARQAMEMRKPPAEEGA